MARASWTAAVCAAAVAAACMGGGGDAAAFCGFYVSGAEARLTNNATQVVLMREGLRTVLSMQNGYQGPPQDFALVIPVPVVLHKENVKTLPRDVFDRVDQLTAPRLVEYWEQDPCPKPMPAPRPKMMASEAFGAGAAPAMAAPAPPPVKIEAQFSVNEYDIVILSATDSSALDGWLRQNGYKIPDGAEPYLRPYVQMGMKFFVAKVDVSKVKFERIGSGPEQAILSPLRFHYDSDAFDLPVRLGLINSAGTQDLVVTILARGQRYEVANYDNVAIPTNVDVSDATRGDFASFYAALFDQTIQRHPRSVVTEYSWAAASCDPCPTPPLQANDLMTLGADVLSSTTPAPQTGAGAPLLRPAPMMPWQVANGFVITRLHARYAKTTLGDDLYFRAAPPIVGGREFVQTDGKLEQGARPDATNNFQARYVIRHPWTGPIACKSPRRGVWGGPPASNPLAAAPPAVKPAARIGFIARSGRASLAAFVRGVLPPENVLSTGGATPLFAAPRDEDAGGEIDDASPETPDAASTPPPPPPPALPSTAPRSGCSGCSSARGNGALGEAIAAVALLGLLFVRKRRG